MPINDTYVVPDQVVNFLCSHERSFLALRLIHGLLYALDTTLKGKMALVPARFPKEHSVRTCILAAAVGPEKAKDNRWIHDACKELADQKILIEPKIQGRTFRFQLSNDFLAAFSRSTKGFAIMRTEHVRQCSTLHDLFFLSLACLHGGKKHPWFLLPRIPVHLDQTTPKFSVLPQDPPQQDLWRVAWSRSSRSWTNAALRVSEILGHSYLFAPRQDMVDDFVSEVAVKVQHSKTKWERGKLYKFPPGTRSVIEIAAGRGSKTTLNAEALQHKWFQTEIQ